MPELQIRDYVNLSSVGYPSCNKCGVALKVGDWYHTHRTYRKAKGRTVSYYHLDCWNKLQH